MGTITLTPNAMARRHDAGNAGGNTYKNGWYLVEYVVEGEGLIESSPWDSDGSLVGKTLYTRELGRDYELAFRFPATQLRGKRLTKVSMDLRCSWSGDEIVFEENPLFMQLDVYRNSDPTDYGSGDWVDRADKTFPSGYPEARFTIETSFSAERFDGAYIYITLTCWNSQGQRYKVGDFECVSATFTYQDDGPPSVYAVSTALSQPSELPGKFDGYGIAGVSKCQVTATVMADRPVSSVYFRYTDYAGTTRTVSMAQDGSNIDSYIGTTPTALAPGATVFTVTAVDSEGYSGSASGTLSNVYDYSGPRVLVTGLQRVNSGGSVTDTGEYYNIMVSESHSSIAGQNTVSITAGVKGSSTRQAISAGVWQRSDSAVLTNEDLVYVITVIITDDVGNSATVEASVNGRLRDFVLKRNVSQQSSHFAVGMTPDSDQGIGVSTIQLPANGKIIIGGQDITAWLRNQIGGNW